MPRLNEDLIKYLFHRGIDFSSRKIYLFNDINTKNISILIKAVKLFETVSKEPIHLYISSFGGDLYEMFALYDVIKSCQCAIYTYGIGKVMSAAVLLVAAGTKNHRNSYANTFYMVHSTQIESESGHIERIKASMTHYIAMDEKWYELMEQNSVLNAKEWKKICCNKPDLFFDANVAKQYSIIDNIL